MAIPVGDKHSIGATPQLTASQLQLAQQLGIVGSATTGTTTTNPYPTATWTTSTGDTLNTQEYLTILTLMMTVGPGATKRLIKKLGLQISDEKLAMIEVAIQEVNNNDDLKSVIDECAKELKK